MLTVRFVEARDIRQPCADFQAISRWGLQIRHGSQRHTTRFVEADGAIGGNSVTNVQWNSEIDIEDREDQETLEIALLLEINHPSALGWKRFRHSITTIEMRAFRAMPEQRNHLYQTLRPAGLPFDADLGTLQLSVMYSDDCVEDGYLFGMFCGLAHFAASPADKSIDLVYPSKNLVSLQSCCWPWLEDNKVSDPSPSETAVSSPPREKAACDPPPSALQSGRTVEPGILTSCAAEQRSHEQPEGRELLSSA